MKKLNVLRYNLLRVYVFPEVRDEAIICMEDKAQTRTQAFFVTPRPPSATQRRVLLVSARPIMFYTH